VNILTVVFTVDDEGCRPAIPYTLATIYQTTRYNNLEGCNISTVISGSLPPWHGASSGCGWRNGIRYGG